MSFPPRPEPPTSPTTVADRLHSAAIHLLRRMRKVDEAAGISAARLSVLSVLVFAGPQTLRQLADQEQVRPATMSVMVAGLEEGGFLRRRPHPVDARAVLLQATPRGRRLLTEARSRRIRGLARTLVAFTPEQRQLLDRAATLIERAAQGEPKAEP